MSLPYEGVISLALVDVTVNKHLDDARERLRKDINADLKDIAVQINQEKQYAEKRVKNNILNTWFIGGLFSYDYHRAKIALTKCIALNPSKQITPAEAEKLLPVLWWSCRRLFDNDFSSLMDEIDRYLDTEKAMGEDALPFM